MLLKSLQWRLVAIITSIAFFLIVPVFILLNNKVESSYYDEFKRRIDWGFENWSIRSDSSLDKVRSYLTEDRYEGVLFSIDEYKSYTIIDSGRMEIEYSSDSVFAEGSPADKSKLLGEILKSDNMVSVLAGTSASTEKKLTRVGGKSYFDYAKQVKLKDGSYIFYFRYDSDAWRDFAATLNNTILNSLAFSIIVALILGYILSKTITVPVVRIMHKARGLASGEFDQVLEVKSDDEIGKLTSTFNYMAKSLKDTLTEISSEKNKIETILNYMTDGVIAFDLKGNVIHSNPASRRLLGRTEFSGTFNEYAAEYGFDITIEDIIYLDSPSSREAVINANGKTLRLYFAVFSDELKKPEGIIAVLQDVTEQQRLDDMRRDFVANVSHELRTPLTSIKSYTETLLDGALEDNETTVRFLGVVNSEADRMSRLVRDLLQLSRLDNNQMRWNMERMSFTGLVKKAVEKMMMEANIKNQTLECFTIGDIPDITADYDRIEQVVLNILSNAIKYTPDGGNITAYIGKLYNEVYLKVTDTGIGIPEKDLPRLFERFYRVDKARSREMGGTGLGLAIAKEIVDAHDGSVSIKSEPEKGTEVTVKLPINRENIGY